jgi:hypothetical protein
LLRHGASIDGSGAVFRFKAAHTMNGSGFASLRMGVELGRGAGYRAGRRTQLSGEKCAAAHGNPKYPVAFFGRLEYLGRCRDGSKLLKSTS